MSEPNPAARPAGSAPGDGRAFDTAAALERTLGGETACRAKRPRWLSTHARYGLYLAHEFRWPLGVFLATVLVGGLVLHHCYAREHVGLARAFYVVFLMVFLESGLDFPDEWYLQPLFFLVPLVGLGAVADSVVRLAYLVFTKKQRLPEWQRMVASLHRDHVIVVGAGRVGYSVIKGLLELNEPVVVIESEPNAPLLDDLYDRDVPVIVGSGRTAKVLAQAGVAHARALIATTQDDLTNLDTGLTAHDLNPNARIVLRLFDETLAAKVTGAFAMPTVSTAQVSAPAFIAAATGRKVYQGFPLLGRTVHLTDMVVCVDGGLVGLSVGGLQADKQANVVMHQGRGGVDLNPSVDVALSPGDTILVIAPIDRLLALEALNRPGAGPSPSAPAAPARPARR